MIKKTENCIYCGEKMESITAKKKYCSAKCKLYFNREKNIIKRGPPFKNMPPYEENSGSITVEFKKLDKIAAKLGVSKPKADVGNKFYKEPVELTLNRQPEPPDGLKGIDLVIWKSENWK